MKKMITKLFMFLFMIALLSGCGNTDEPVELNQPYNVSLVAVIANNNPVLDTGIDEIAHLPDVAGTTYSFVLADSTPNLICDGIIPDFTKRGYSKEMIERAQSSVSADIIGKLNEAEPDSNDIDLATAISLAVRKIRSNEMNDRDNLLVLYGSGISTYGVIDLTQIPVSELDINASVTSISNTMNLDLSDIKVIWYCCGDVAGTDQPPLSDNERKQLKEFYENLFMELGALEVKYMDDVPLDGCYSFEQHVNVMDTEGLVIGLQDKVVKYEEVEEKEAMENILTEGTILSFDEKSIAFKPDSTELVDEQAALDTLNYTVSYMEKNPDFILMICATTSSAGEKEECIEFSKGRGETIKNLLIQAGIDETKMVVLGCGWSSCLYVEDRDAYGNLNEYAPLNRSVKLVNYQSTAAQTIIDSIMYQ